MSEVYIPDFMKACERGVKHGKSHGKTKPSEKFLKRLRYEGDTHIRVSRMTPNERADAISAIKK